MTNPERALQITIVNALKLALTPATFWTHFPSGVSLGRGRERFIRGDQLKNMGLRPGVPDLLFIHEGQAFWMELKSDKGRLSENQIATHAQLKAAGSHVETVRSLEDALECLNIWRIPLRLSAAA